MCWVYLLLFIVSRNFMDIGVFFRLCLCLCLDYWYGNLGLMFVLWFVVVSGGCCCVRFGDVRVCLCVLLVLVVVVCVG